MSDYIRTISITSSFSDIHSDDSAVDLKCFSPNNTQRIISPTLKNSLEITDVSHQYSNITQKRDNLSARTTRRYFKADQNNETPMDSYKERSIQEFSTRTDYVWAMREDISNWLTKLGFDDITPGTLFKKLKSGVILCNHANSIYDKSLQSANKKVQKPSKPLQNFTKKPLSVFAFRDNVTLFINWLRQELNFKDYYMFETNDLINEVPESPGERNVIVCLLELIAYGGNFGIQVSDFIALEQEILAEENDIKMVPTQTQKRPKKLLPSQHAAIKMRESLDSSDVSSITSSSPSDLPMKKFKNIDTGVKSLVQGCTCPDKFELFKMASDNDCKTKGKYKLGTTNTILYLRILNSHILVRVGGGWDTLDNWLMKHDPCRKNRKPTAKMSMSPDREVIVEKDVVTEKKVETPKISRRKTEILRTKMVREKHITTARRKSMEKMTLPASYPRRKEPLKKFS